MQKSTDELNDFNSTWFLSLNYRQQDVLITMDLRAFANSEYDAQTLVFHTIRELGG